MFSGAQGIQKVVFGFSGFRSVGSQQTLAARKETLPEREEGAVHVWPWPQMVSTSDCPKYDIQWVG